MSAPTPQIQRSPDYYAAPVNRDGTVVEILDAHGTVETVTGEEALFFLTTEPLDAAAALAPHLKARYFYETDGSPGPLDAPEDVRREVLRRGKGLKLVPVFADLTFVHNTSRLELLDPRHRMKTNPIVVLNRLHRRIFDLVDGQRSVGDVYGQMTLEFGDILPQTDFLAFLGDLEALRFLDGEGVLASRYGNLDVADRTWDLNAAKIQNQLVYMELPLYLLLEPTHDCNINCPDCYMHGFDAIPDLEEEVFLESVLDPVIESGVSHVTLLGGEPMLKPELMTEIVGRLRRADVYAKMLTNGILVDERNAAALDEAGLNRIEVSMDGFTAATNDKVRGAGTFERILECIAHFRRTGIPEIGLSVTVTSETVEEICRDLPEFFHAHGLHKIYFSQFYSPWRGGWRELTRDEKARLTDKCSEWNETLTREIPRFEAVVLGQECTCGRSSVVVSPNGELRACPFMPLQDESLTTGRSLRDIWQNSEEFWKIRSLPRDICSARNRRDTGDVGRSIQV